MSIRLLLHLNELDLCGLFNHPIVPRAVLQTPWSLSQSVILFLKIFKNHNSQTVRARELKLWENVQITPCVISHMSPSMLHLSPVTSHQSPVTCKMPQVTCPFLYLFIYFFFNLQFFLMWLSYLVDGLLSTGLTLYSFTDWCTDLNYYSIKKSPNKSSLFRRKSNLNEVICWLTPCQLLWSVG